MKMIQNKLIMELNLLINNQKIYKVMIMKKLSLNNKEKNKLHQKIK